MLMLKLQRIGKKHQASYRLIVGEKREKLDGAQLEDLGWFDPHANKSEFKKDRIEYWLSKGAGHSDTVHNLLVAAGILKEKKIAKHKQPKAAEGSSAKAGATEGGAKSAMPTAEAKPAEVKPEAPVEEKK